MNYEFGSIEIASQQMILILQDLNTQMPFKNFVIVGDVGCGKSTMAEHVRKTIFKSQRVEILDYAPEMKTLPQPAIYMVSKLQWAQVKPLFETAVVIMMPTLNDRKADIPQLAKFFLQVLCLMHNLPVYKLTEKSVEMICQYDWSGNFYEFESILEAALQLAADEHSRGWIEPSHLNLNLNPKSLDFTVGLKLDEIERRYILQTLYFAHQNRTKAADILGISIRTLRNKINQYREEGYL